MPKGKAQARADAAREQALREMVEAIGLWFEAGGVPRMAGRVMGWLLICDPPEQTMQELAENLNASMGSMSTMTRVLTQFGLIERVSLPGERRIRYRIRSDAWNWSVDERMNHIRAFLDLAGRALEILGESDPGRRHRLEMIDKAVRYYDEEYTRLAEKWKSRTEGYATNGS